MRQVARRTLLVNMGHDTLAIGFVTLGCWLLRMRSWQRPGPVAASSTASVLA